MFCKKIYHVKINFVNSNLFKDQILPLALTVLVFFVLVGVLFFEIIILNHFNSAGILVQLRWFDVIIGLTVYLKTSIDFAIFIARMMESNRGWKGRVAIEIGTAAGNAAGTLLILLVWSFFRNVEWLLALLIFVAALVLFRLAQDGLDHAVVEDKNSARWFQLIVAKFDWVLTKINSVINPVLKYIIPNTNVAAKSNLPFWNLFVFAFTIPFILGLDDFAGYVPLFNVVNVFGFAVGVFAGHMVLNAFLFISPARTIRIVKNPIISFLGSVAFVGLGIWGLVEVIRIFL